MGFDTRAESEQIRELMGICPQENVLWDQLTSYEHLLLYGSLRGLPQRELPAMINRKLQEFHLHDLIKSPTANLSGGMKRRLSLAMATLGEPQIVFLVSSELCTKSCCYLLI